MDLEPVGGGILVGSQDHAAFYLGNRTAFILQNSRAEQVDMIRREGGDGLDMGRLYTQDPLGQAGAVDTQVVGGAAQGVPAHADIFGIVVGGQEGGLHVAHIADDTAVDRVGHGCDIGGVLVGKGFHQMHAVCLGGGEHGGGFFCIGGQGLFAQHVLFGVQGFDGPLGVQRIGQGDVDGLHFRVVQQCLVAAVGLLEAEAGLEFLGLFKAAAGDGVELAIFGLAHALGGGACENTGGADDAPFDLSHTVTSVNNVK